jgi:hypothetical protein
VTGECAEVALVADEQERPQAESLDAGGHGCEGLASGGAAGPQRDEDGRVTGVEKERIGQARPYGYAHHPHWRPAVRTMLSSMSHTDCVDEVELIGGPEKRAVVIKAYDPDWPEIFEEHRRRIREALGDVALRVDHVGSTAVTGLPAKPIVDIQLSVCDVEKEPSYLEPLVGAGYRPRASDHQRPSFLAHRRAQASSGSMAAPSSRPIPVRV